MNRSLLALGLALLAACSSPSEPAPDAAATTPDAATRPDAEGVVDAESPPDADEPGLDASSAKPPDATIAATDAGAPDTGPACTRSIAPCSRLGTAFSDDFEDAVKVKADWGNSAVLEPSGSGHALAVSIPAGSPGSKSVAHPLDPAALAGARIYVSAKIRAQDVTTPPQSWNGIKVMLALTDADGTTRWPQIKVGTGTFEWGTFSMVAIAPGTLASARLVLGLESVTGSASFDDVRVEVVSCPPTVHVEATCPIEKGHPGIPMLRGAMVPPSISSQSLKVLGTDWNANLLRWQLGGTQYTEGLETPDYFAVLDAQLALLDAALPTCAANGLRVAVDLHSLSEKQFASPAAQDRLVEAWRRIATRYKDSPVVWAYDLANEPREDGWQPGMLLWRDLAERVGKEIRRIDPVHTLIVEPAPWGNPDGFEGFFPIDVPNVVYSVHFYLPHAFTHQLVYPDYPATLDYPGQINGTQWDKAQMLKALQPVIDFQERYRVAIYVGEFSAIRWAPNGSAYRYLDDTISIFEARGWDWSYHAFREWTGWSVECGEEKSDPCASYVSTPRQTLLRSHLSKNVKP